MENRGETKEKRLKVNNAWIFFLLFTFSDVANKSCTVHFSGKTLMMTTLKCEELIEVSLGSLPSASFGAVLQAVTAETPITDQVPLGWRLTVTSKF